jgi:hypothetical protein
MGKTKEKLRLNFREAWFFNLDEVTTSSDNEVTFRLKRPQPTFFRCSLPVIRRSIRAISRRAISARIRSAPGRSDLSNTGLADRSGCCEIRIIGNRADGIEYTMVAHLSTGSSPLPRASSS